MLNPFFSKTVLGVQYFLGFFEGENVVRYSELNLDTLTYESVETVASVEVFADIVKAHPSAWGLATRKVGESFTRSIIL